MRYALRAGVSFAFVGERAVFLDLIADRYFCIGAVAEQSLRRAAEGGQLDAADHRAMAPLLNAGLLSPDTTAPVGLSATRIDMRASMFDGPDRPGGWRVVPTAMIDLVAAKWTLARRPLSTALGRLLARRAEAGYLTPRMIVTRIEAVVAAYRSVDFLLRNPDQCLPSSLAMARTLARSGIGCDVVFGVTLAPFRAHCWVQRDGVVLNDSLDHARAYVPVLAL